MRSLRLWCLLWLIPLPCHPLNRPLKIFSKRSTNFQWLIFLLQARQLKLEPRPTELGPQHIKLRPPRTIRPRSADEARSIDQKASSFELYEPTLCGVAPRPELFPRRLVP